MRQVALIMSDGHLTSAPNPQRNMHSHVGASTFDSHRSLKNDKIPMRYLFLLMSIFCACDRRTDNKHPKLTETKRDSLAVFPLEYQMEFIATNSNDQIALLFKRETIDTFRYRIELLRKRKGLPLDNGIVQIQKIYSDSIYVFRGGNSDCDVVIKINKKKDLAVIAHFSANLERTCKQVSLNIEESEFPNMWCKGGTLRR